jgi:dipeptidyl aminopeptidase/acylaminoacyl peptidase
MHNPSDRARRSPTIRLIRLCVVALMFSLAPRAGHTVPLGVYGGLASLENVALSPDGSRIAYVRTEGNARIVFVVTVADQKLIRYARFGEDKLRSVEWADNDNVLITTSQTTAFYGFRQKVSLVSVYNVPKNQIRSLPGEIPGIYEHSSNVVVGEVVARHVDGHTVLFVPAVDAIEGLALVRCDLTSGLNRLMKTGARCAQRVSEEHHGTDEGSDPRGRSNPAIHRHAVRVAAARAAHRQCRL